MSCAHDDTLSAIERQGLSAGIAADEIDQHVADVLSVPPDHYAAWQVVTGAITSYAHTHRPVVDDADHQVRRPDEAVADQLRRLWEHLGTIHHAAISGGSPSLVREQARELIAELFELTDRLLVGSPTIDHPARGEQGVDRG